MHSRLQGKAHYSPKIIPGAYNVVLDRKLLSCGKDGYYTTLFFTNKSSHKNFFVTVFHSGDNQPVAGGINFNLISNGSPLWVHIDQDQLKYPTLINAEYGWRHVYKGSSRVWSKSSLYKGPLRKDIDEDAHQLSKSIKS
jgi:hypothetical protein